MCDFRFMENWLLDETVDVSASSEDAAFPVSNLSKHSRSDVWRSSGNFVITTSNQKLDFKIAGGGAELTATVGVGTYTATELAAYLEAAMQAFTADIITVSFDAGVWTIETSGAYLSLLWQSGSNTASNLGNALGYGRTTDSTGATSYDSSYLALHTEEWILIDLGTWGTNPVDSAVLIFETGVGSKLSPSATVKLQASQTNVWASPSVNVTLSYDTTYEIYSYFFSSDQNYRYWRIQIVDPQNANGYVEIPKILLSNSVELTLVPENGFEYQVLDMSRLDQTQYGVVFSDIYPFVRDVKFTYSTLTEADVETLWQLFQRVGKTTPIGVVLDSQATTFDKDRFFLYGRMNGDFATKHRSLTYFDSGFGVREAL